MVRTRGDSRCTERTQDVGGNQVENGAPPSSADRSGGIFPLSLAHSHVVGGRGGGARRGNSLLVLGGYLLADRRSGIGGVDAVGRSFVVGKPALDNRLPGPWALGGDVPRVFFLLLCSGDRGIVHCRAPKLVSCQGTLKRQNC